jgi:putative transposase
MVNEEEHKSLMDLSIRSTAYYNDLITFIQKGLDLSIPVSQKSIKDYGKDLRKTKYNSEIHSQIAQDIVIRVLKAFDDYAKNAHIISICNNVIDQINIHHRYDKQHVIADLRFFFNIKALQAPHDVQDLVVKKLTRKYKNFIKYGNLGFMTYMMNKLHLKKDSELLSITFSQHKHNWRYHKGSRTICMPTISKRNIEARHSYNKIGGDITAMDVSYVNNKWMAHVTVKTLKSDFVSNKIVTSLNKDAVALDFGLLNVVALSDNTIIKTISPLRQYLDKVKELDKKIVYERKILYNKFREQKRIDIHTKRSDYKTSITMSSLLETRKKVFYKVKNIRANFHNQIAHYLDTHYSKVIMEWHGLEFMLKNHKLALTAHDVGIGALRDRIIQVMGAHRITKVSAYKNSQTCSCGAEVKKTLDVRVHECECCGMTGDRDVVAADRAYIKVMNVSDLFARYRNRNKDSKPELTTGDRHGIDNNNDSTHEDRKIPDPYVTEKTLEDVLLSTNLERHLIWSLPSPTIVAF